MEKIKYIYNIIDIYNSSGIRIGFDAKSATSCPYYYEMFVGSEFCQKCDYCEDDDRDSQTVTCSYLMEK
jgi:hypothetical protein